MAHTDKDEDVAEYIYNLLDTNKVALGLNEVLYGNHTQINLASAAVVQALGKDRTLTGVAYPGGVTENQLRVAIDLHWSRVGDEATERRNADSKSRLIEKKLHEDTTLGGLIIHGFVNSMERGITTVSSGMYRSVRMNYIGTTKTHLSPPAAPA